MKTKPIALAVAALALGLTACTVQVPTPTPAPAPVVQEQSPVQPVQGGPDWPAFLDAIAPGFVIRDLPRQPVPEAAPLRDAIQEAALNTCGVLEYGTTGRQSAYAVAEEALADRSVFTADMPVLFVDSADAWVCGR